MRGSGVSLDPIYTYSESGLASVIGTMGSRNFSNQMFEFVSSKCGAVHCLSAEVSNGVPQIISLRSGKDHVNAKRNYDHYSADQHWKIDPVIEIARETEDFSNGALFHVPKDELPPRLAQRIYDSHTSDRLVLLQAFQEKIYMIALFRTPDTGEFSDDHVRYFRDTGSDLVAAMAKHSAIVNCDKNLVRALTSLSAIETNIALLLSELSGRERQVCARLLYGMSNAGIALDLGIGEETSTTYKKRAFSRLNIGSNRELLHLYVNCLF